MSSERAKIFASSDADGDGDLIFGFLPKRANVYKMEGKIGRILCK